MSPASSGSISSTSRNAINHLGDDGEGMWNEEDGFFYDVLHMPDGEHVPLRVRSMVGLIPLFAVETLEPRSVDRLTGFKRRLEWFIENRHGPDGTMSPACKRPAKGERRLLSIVDRRPTAAGAASDAGRERIPFAVRNSRASRAFISEHPYVLRANGAEYRVDYEPGESTTGLFGGNSNWRGPIWFPVNFLLIESLQKFHHYFGDDFKVECPTGSGQIHDAMGSGGGDFPPADPDLSPGRRRPAARARQQRLYSEDPHWRDLVLFYEYFHGDNGAGVGASHQTGWTGLVAKLLQQSGERETVSTEISQMQEVAGD